MKHTEEARAKMRASHHSKKEGFVSPLKGSKMSDETRAKMSASAKARPSNHAGKTHSPETRARIAKATKERTARGENHYAYIDGRKARHQDIRRSTEYATWRLAVFTRDKFTCQDCQDQQGGNLEAHHLKPFAEFPALQMDVDNGVTLCMDCHEKRHPKPVLIGQCRRKKHLPAPRACRKRLSGAGEG
jgi:5-methylcytosine-specific restriction endonuclease McrA